MRRFVIGLVCAAGGYALGASAGYVLIQWFSSNMHDRSVEAVMTAAFVFGPLGAVIGFVVGFVLGGRRSRRGEGSMEPGDAEAFARRYTAAWCSQDPARVASFFAENGSLRINAGASSVGRGAITAAALKFMTDFLE